MWEKAKAINLIQLLYLIKLIKTYINKLEFKHLSNLFAFLHIFTESTFTSSFTTIIYYFGVLQYQFQILMNCFSKLYVFNPIMAILYMTTCKSVP